MCVHADDDDYNTQNALSATKEARRKSQLSIF